MKKILLLSIVLISTFVMHYIGKAKVYKYSRNLDNLAKEEKFLSDENKSLLSAQSNYLSKERVTKIAQTNLGMVFSKDIENSVCIVKQENVESKTNFVLIDFLVTDANALNK